MKIKTKKQFTLPQLIEWAMKNDMHEKSFCGDRYGDAVHFDENEDMLCDHVSLTETFTVEVEEEVNGETILDRLYEVSFNGLAHDTNIYTNTTTNSLITSTTALIYTVIDNQVIVLWEKYTGGFR